MFATGCTLKLDAKKRINHFSLLCKFLVGVLSLWASQDREEGGDMAMFSWLNMILECCHGSYIRFKMVLQTIHHYAHLVTKKWA